jgi:hypothetical protein
MDFLLGKEIAFEFWFSFAGFLGSFIIPDPVPNSLMFS